MDALVRGRRLVLIAAAIGALGVACAAASSGPAVGSSDRPPAAGALKAEIRDAGARDGAAALPAGYRQTFTRITPARMPSKGHAAGRWEVEVWANDLAKEALAARAREVPVGAVVVAEHYERGAAGPVMSMEKRERGYAPEHGDWRWVVVGASGALVREGVVEQCAGCHDDAPADGLFPIVP